MKRLIMGDIHGHDSWKHFYNTYKPERVIMLGDYFDGFNSTPQEQYDNFMELLNTKKQHESMYGEGSFIMLLGNHDFHYIHPSEQYSGYNHGTAFNFTNELNAEFKAGHIPVVYVDYINKTIYSHAGVTNTYLRYNELESLEDINNFTYIQHLQHTSAGHDSSHNSWYGDTIYNSPIWVRPYSLLEDSYKDNEGNIWTQVVGHTHVKELLHITDNGTDIYVCDTMPKQCLLETLDEEGNIKDCQILTK